MEHNAERLIREKVHEADQLAVTWRKEWAWDHIDLTAEKKSARWFYYAAASLLFAGVAVVSFIQWNQRQSTLAKINALEMKIASVLEEQTKAVAPLALDEVKCGTSQAIIRPVERKQMAKRSVEPQPVTELPPSEVHPTEIEIALVEPPVQPLETPVVTTQVSKPVVQAIIGIIPAQSETVANTPGKKFRLRLFNTPQLQDEYLSIDENKFITAKLK